MAVKEKVRKKAPKSPRFVPKKDRGKWFVFDREVSSWPIEVVGFGMVRQNMSDEEEAWAEAKRLEDLTPAKPIN